MSDNVLLPRLVMIDDDPAFCRLVTRVARPHGFEVVATDDPKEFKRAIQSSVPTLIVLDLQMPGTDGIELLRDLASNRCPAAIVLASGLDSRTLDAALRLGAERGLKMAGVLQKPVSLEDMRDLLVKYRPADSAQLIRDLEAAIVADQLFLEYQPKIDGPHGRITGVEALVRWRHPSLGVIRPDQFIPLAEETDLIEPLTAWVFAAAARQAAAWQQQGLALDVAINVSAKNLRDIQLPDRLARQCQEFGISPDVVTLELTETSAMRDAIQMMDVLTRLRIKGFKLSIDDFGTGYSSLIQLRKMPFSELKIDLSFVINMMHDKDCGIIAEVIIDLARKMGLKSVAEGVESELIWNRLLALGCDRGQGYYLGRPMAADRIVSTFAAAAVVSNNSLAVAQRDGSSSLDEAKGPTPGNGQSPDANGLVVIAPPDTPPAGTTAA